MKTRKDWPTPENGSGQSVPKKNKKKKKHRGAQILLVILMVILLLLMVVVAAAYAYYLRIVGNLQPDETRDPNEALSSSEMADLGGDPLDSQLGSQLSGLPTVVPTIPTISNTVPPEYTEHVTNILLIGTDERTQSFSNKARGDSCMLLSINTSGSAPVVSLVSFERGMGMPILSGHYAGQWDWLTHLFRYGGAEMMMQSIETCFNIKIDHYVRVNFATFAAGIDALGGVDVKFSSKEAEYFNRYSDMNAVVGTNHLNGENALRFARLRSIDSDWQRIERQRKIISAAINKLKTKNLAELDALITTCTKLVRTDLTQDAITRLLLEVVPGLTNVTVQQMTIPQKGTYGSQKVMGGRNAFAPDFEENTRLLHNMIYGLSN